MSENVKKLLAKYEKFIKFCLVGGMNAILSIIIYNALIYLVHLGEIPANSIAFIITVINGFYWNKNHVFKNADKNARVKFFLLYGITFCLSNLIIWVLVSIFSMDKSIAQIISLIINTFVNFFASKYWVFRGK